MIISARSIVVKIISAPWDLVIGSLRKHELVNVDVSAVEGRRAGIKVEPPHPDKALIMTL